MNTMNTTMIVPQMMVSFSGSVPQGTQSISEKDEDEFSLPIDIAARNLSSKKSDMERLEKDESKLDAETKALLKEVNKLIKEDKILRKMPKITPCIGMPSFMVAVSCATLCPAVAITGLVLTGASVVALEYSKRRVKKIDMEFEPKKQEYLKNFGDLEHLRYQKRNLADEVSLLEKQYNVLVEKRDNSTREFGSMVDHLNDNSGGEPWVKDEDDYLDIDGIRLKKRGFDLTGTQNLMYI